LPRWPGCFRFLSAVKRICLSAAESAESAAGVPCVASITRAGACPPVRGKWLTVKKAAEQLGDVSAKLVYKMFDRGVLDGIKVEGALRISQASVTRYLRVHRNKKPRALPPGVDEEPKPVTSLSRRSAGRAGRRESGYRFFPRSVQP
jgi:hypothetical protein